MAVVDPFDPNNWEKDNHEYRIYADDYANQYAIVDQVDYQYLVQWRWRLKQSRVSPNTKKPKVYFARTEEETLAQQYHDENGNRIRHRISRTLFMHTAIMERTGLSKPITNSKIIVDHADGDSFHCRRRNLRYATISFNNKNLHGAYEHMLTL